MPAGKMPTPQEITNKDYELLLDLFVAKYGFTSHQTPIYDRFLREGIAYVLTNLFNIEQVPFENKRRTTDFDKSIKSIRYSVDWTNVRVTPPSRQRLSAKMEEPLSPIVAHQNDLNFLANIYVSYKVTAVATKEDETTITRTETKSDVLCGRIPIPTMSEKSMLHKMPPSLLLAQHWDPFDFGAAFIIKGREIAGNLSEELIFNVPKIYINKGYQHEVIRLELVSRDGDSFENSYQIIIRKFKSGMISFESVYNKIVIHVPFFVAMRLFGVVDDADVVSHVLMTDDLSGEVEQTIYNHLNTAFHAPLEKDMEMYSEAVNIYDTNELITYITTVNANLDGSETNAIRYLNKEGTNKILDDIILPHIGRKFADRPKKARYIGYLINRLIRTQIGILPETDRDSAHSKRYYPPAISMTKQIKHALADVTRDIRKTLTKQFENSSFPDVRMAETIYTVLSRDTLTTALVKAVHMGKEVSDSQTVGSARVNSATTRNHMRTEMYNPKSSQFLVNTLRTIRTRDIGSKMTERAKEKRMVHPTFIGYTCPITSADTGEKVGNVKNMAITERITYSSSSHALKVKILTNSAMPVYPIMSIPVTYIASKAKIFVNGDLIACCDDSEKFLKYYRELRRRGEIDREVTIYWDNITDDILFWADFGRAIRPLVIVYEDPNDTKIVTLPDTGAQIKVPRQYTKFDRALVERILTDPNYTFDDLLKDGVVEFISDEEQTNCLLAENHELLKSREYDPLLRYTHCEITLAPYGLLALQTPFSRFSMTQRTCYATNQAKQTMGIPRYNYPYRFDRQAFMLHSHEDPLVTTFSSRHIPSGSKNLVILIGTYKGFGMQDSCIIKRDAVDYGCMAAAYVDVRRSTLETNERWGVPPGNTSPAFSKIIPGRHYPAVNTRIKEGDVIIAKYLEERVSGDSAPRIVDRSVVWDRFEEMIVEDVIAKTHDADQNIICKIKLRAYRPVRIGDKFASTSGNKSINGLNEDAVNLPYTEDGNIPDIIINPQAFVSRQIAGQIYECAAALLGAITGAPVQATMHDDITIDDIKQMLEKYGVMNCGLTRCYNGVTGLPIECEMYVGINFYMRLEKNVIDEVHAVTSGPTNALTRQMIRGKNVDGGLRTGEMERDVFIAAGAANILHDKFANNTTRFIIYVCKSCGHYAINGRRRDLCKFCGPYGEIVAVPTTYVNNTIQHLIEAMHIKPQFELEPPCIEI